MTYIVGAMLLALLGGGIMLVWMGVGELWRGWQRVPQTVICNGIVRSIHRERKYMHRFDGGGLLHSVWTNFPIVQFTTTRGEIITFRSEVGDAGDVSAFGYGQHVRVLYNPTGQSPPRIDSWAGRWYVPVTLIAAGLLLMGVPAALVALIIRQWLGQ